jgi:predicted ATPase/DNA-binding XRE family transcriptional regulator
MMGSTARQWSSAQGFADLLRHYRTAAGLSQEDLAERSGLSVRAISDLERGIRTRPRFETVRMLADAMKLGLSERANLLSAARPSGALIEQRVTPPAIPALSIPPTSLVGREADAAEVAALLRDGETRLLVLTGAGGVGKTRLALQVANDLWADFADGVAFVDLAGVADVTLVLPIAARGLGVREESGRPLMEALRERLRGLRPLLVLDNCEHLPLAPLVAELLAACPELRVLATSRAPLHLKGEQLYPVLPLAVPPPDPLPSVEELLQVPAVYLFVQRARAVRPDFELTGANARDVAAICRRLDGLPLALELAAARLRMLSPAALLALMEERLRLLTGGWADAPPRQQTLRATIAWSHDLLSPEAQVLFSRLSVFVGGFPLEAVAAVAMEEDTFAVLAGLETLADQSLLRRTQHDPIGGPRFIILETIREYGLEMLAASGTEAASRERHARYFLDLAEEAETHLASAVEPIWLDRLEAEHDNLRTALASFSEYGVTEHGLRLAGAMWLFWYYRGYLTEGRRWLEQVLQSSEGVDSSARAKALLGLGALAHFQGDEQRSAEVLEESLALSRKHGDSWTAAFALTVMGNLAEDLGDYSRAGVLFEEARDLFQDLDDEVNTAVTIYHLGVVAYGRGDLEEASSLLAQALTIAQQIGDPWSTAITQSYLSLVACDRGDYRTAATALDESLTLLMNIGTTERIAAWLRRAAVVATASGRFSESVRIMAAASVLEDAIGITLALPERLTYERALNRSREALGEEKFSAIWATGRTMTEEQAIADATRVIADAASGTQTSSQPNTTNDRG